MFPTLKLEAFSLISFGHPLSSVIGKFPVFDTAVEFGWQGPPSQNSPTHVARCGSGTQEVKSASKPSDNRNFVRKESSFFVAIIVFYHAIEP